MADSSRSVANTWSDGGSRARARRFGQQHGNRVRLLPGGAPRNPHAHLVLRELVVEQPRHDVPLERRKRVRIAEELRDADQQLALQRLHLLLVIPQEARVRLDVGQVVQMLPPRDSAEHGGRLVVREVVAGAEPDQRQDLRQARRGLCSGGRQRIVALHGLRAGEPAPGACAGISPTGRT